MQPKPVLAPVESILRYYKNVLKMNKVEAINGLG